MNKKMSLIFSVLLILMASCQPSTSTSDEVVVPLTAVLPSPDIIINDAMDAWNAGDAAALKILFADNATVCFPDWGDECTTGTEEVGGWIEELMAANFFIEPESLEVEGGTVTVIAKVWADPTRALDIAPLVTTDVYTVQNGKITNQTSMLNEESASKLMSAMADVQTSGVVTAFMDAINAGDSEMALSFLHENVYIEMTPTLLSGFPKIFGGQDILNNWLEEMIDVNLKIEIADLTVARSTVTVKSKISSDYLQSLHVESIPVDDTFVIRDGQIETWNRTIPISSLNKLQDGLVELGIPEVITPESGEVLATEVNDIIGNWDGMLTPGGDKFPIYFGETGKYTISGDKGSFLFNGSFLWVISEEVLLGDTLHSCMEKGNIGSYVVYMTRSGDIPVELRLVPILDPCGLRADLIGGEPLTPK